MLAASLWIFGATVLLGLLLVMLHALQRWRVVTPLGLVHAAAGAAGLAVLIFALLSSPARGVSEGVGTFGRVAATMLGFAFLAGASIWRGRRKRSDPTVLIGIHASLAIFGVVILAAYLAAPS